MISSVKVDQDGKVDIKCTLTLKPNIYQYLLQNVYVSDSGNQVIMVVGKRGRQVLYPVWVEWPVLWARHLQTCPSSRLPSLRLHRPQCHLVPEGWHSVSVSDIG